MIFDELHHAGDALSWGEAVGQAFDAGRTSPRADRDPVPLRRHPDPVRHLRTDEADGTRRSVADYTYGYAEALRDHVVRPVVFLAYGGGMRWRTRAGDELAANLGQPLTKDVTAQAWRTALDPAGEWMPRRAAGG